MDTRNAGVLRAPLASVHVGSPGDRGEMPGGGWGAAQVAVAVSLRLSAALRFQLCPAGTGEMIQSRMIPADPWPCR